jgi:hypothetical protein
MEIPIACQNVISGNLNTSGITAFQSNQTGMDISTPDINASIATKIIFTITSIFI